MDLKFGHVEEYGSYGGKWKFKSLERRKFMTLLKAFILDHPQFPIESNDGFLITTQVSGKLWWKKYVCVLDCDSLDDLKKACMDLNYHRYRYKVYESSPECYWVVLDGRKSISECIDIMKVTEGIDRHYVRMIEKHRLIAIRAFPKGTFKPRFVGDILIPNGKQNPSFILNFVPFQDDKVEEWSRNFTRYWQGGEVDWVINKRKQLYDPEPEPEPEPEPVVKPKTRKLRLEE